MLWALALAAVLAVEGPAQDQSSPPPSRCNCSDIERLKDRLQKLQGIEKLIARKLQSVAANAPATQADWSALQSEINSYLRALQMQNLTQFSDTSLFSADPACGPVGPTSSCMDQIFSVHTSEHSASCKAGHWNFQSPWTAPAMLHEETAAIQAEIDQIRKTIDQLPCTPCPQFMVTVQVVTTTAINGPLTERSSRSLNNGQGIRIPLTVDSNGTFQGVASGIDAGSGFGATRGETVGGQFGHAQSIYANGTIQSGKCSGGQPCSGDIMHIVLVGGTSQQITEMHARGVVNRDINQVTPTGAATMAFDLPAYVGGSSQRTLLANSMISSVMRVTLSQLNEGTAALPDGSSLLYSIQGCTNLNQITSGGSGPSGAPGGGGESTSASTSGGGGGTGSVAEKTHIPLLVNEMVKLGDNLVAEPALSIAEKVSVIDKVQFSFDLAVEVDESIHLNDSLLWPVGLDIIEKVRVQDAVQSLPSLPVSITENIHATDSFPSRVVVNVSENVTVGEAISTQ